MTNGQSAHHPGNIRYANLILAAIIAAGLAGNAFPFSILNAHFILGSIFAMLALQLFGCVRGVAAAAIISSYTMLVWNHPWALMTMTLEVVVVGWLIKRRPSLSLLMADTFYWLAAGIPLGYVGFHVISNFPSSNSLFLLTKQAINGMANALIARLLFSVYVFALRSRTLQIAFRELVSSLLAFFALGVALIMLILDSQTDLAEVDRHIRAALIQINKQASESLAAWFEDRKRPIMHLAEMAAALSAEQMQLRLEQTRASDANFLRVALIDKAGISIAYAPLVDEQGQSTIGKNFADRPYIPALKQMLQPMLSEVMVSRFGRPAPVATMLVPVISGDQYHGAVGGIMNFDRIAAILATNAADTHIYYTLTDKHGKIILTNRRDQTALMPFVRSQGTLQRLDDLMSQWIPPLPFNTSTIDLWGQSFYVVESEIWPLSEWHLVLEQPVAPFQKTLYNRYSRRFCILFGMLLVSFGLAEFLGRRVLRATEDLSRLTRDLPGKLASKQQIAWPDSAILEIHDLTGNFKNMAASLMTQFRAIEQMNASLEREVEQQTAQLRETRDYLENLLDYANAPIIVWDTGFRITRFNHAFEHLTGYDADDVVGNPLDMLFPPDQRAASLSYINRAAAGEHWESVEIPILRQDGAVRIALWNSAAIYAPDGKTIRATIVQGQDITDRKQAEEALRASEEKHRRLFETMSQGVIYQAADGAIISANPASEQILGLTFDQMRGKTSMNPRWKMISEDGSVIPGTEHPAMVALRTGKKIGPVIRGVFIPEKEDYVWLSITAIPLFQSGATIPFQAYATFENITDRKQAEEALQKSEARFRAAFENASVGMVFTAPDGELLKINQVFCDMLGYAGAEIQGRNFAELTHPDDLDVSREYVRRMLAEEQESAHFYKRYLHRTGQEIWAEVHTVLLHDRHDQPLHFITHVQNITERRRIEEKLKETTAILQAAMDQSQAGIAIAEAPDGKLRYVNRAGLLISNKPEAELVENIDIAKYVASWQILHPDGTLYRADEVPLARAVLYGETCSEEFVIRRPDAEERTVWANAAPIFDDNGKVQAGIVVFLDITDRKRVEEALRDHQYLLQAIIDNTTSLVYVFNADGCCLLANRNLAALFGASREAMIGQRREDWMSATLAESHRQNDLRVFSTGKPGTFEELGYEVNELHTYLTVKFPLVDSSGAVYAVGGISTDITDRKQAEEEILRLNTELEQRVRDRTAQFEAANKELEAFSYSVSHDLRAPLRHITGFVELLNKHAPERLDEKSRHYLQVISEAAQQMGRLIDDLLSFSRMGRTDMMLTCVKLDELVKEVVALTKRDTGGRDIVWRVGDLPEVHGDPPMLKIVFENLIANAVKFTRARPRAVIEIGRLDEHPDEEVLYVRDNGAGFDMQYVDKLFGLFQRLHRSDEFEGTGLGLANIRRIIHRHGGRVWAEGAVDQGATFYVTLPKTGL